MWLKLYMIWKSFAVAWFLLQPSMHTVFLLFHEKNVYILILKQFNIAAAAELAQRAWLRGWCQLIKTESDTVLIVSIKKEETDITLQMNEIVNQSTYQILVKIINGSTILGNQGVLALITPI